MGSLYRLKQKFVDFCNTTNQIEDSTLTVPTSHVVYDLNEKLDKKIVYRLLYGTDYSQITNLKTLYQDIADEENGTILLISGNRQLHSNAPANKWYFGMFTCQTDAFSGIVTYNTDSIMSNVYLMSYSSSNDTSLCIPVNHGMVGISGFEKVTCSASVTNIVP